MIRFRSRSFLALALTPHAPAEDWLEELDRLLANSRGFFADRSVVLDVSGLTLEPGALPRLIFELAKRDVRVMAIENADPNAIEPGLPPLITNGRDARPDDPAPARPFEDVSEPIASTTLLIEHPVRSGQRIIHPTGDVIVTAQVGSGAEVIAGGSLHIYGTLRGRAVAGTMGHANARIFCQKLHAELLAIDGLYITAENIEASLIGRPVQAWLRGNSMHMSALI